MAENTSRSLWSVEARRGDENHTWVRTDLRADSVRSAALLFLRDAPDDIIEMTLWNEEA